jgi:hypothetical protein
MVESAFRRAGLKPKHLRRSNRCGINTNFNLAQFDRQRAAEFQGCQNWPNVSASCALWREPGHGPKNSENFGVLIQTLPRRMKALFFFEVPVWPNYVTALPRLNLVAPGSCIPARLSVAIICVSDTYGSKFMTCRTTGLSFLIRTFATSA